MSEQQVCMVCGRTRKQHDSWARHAFTPPGTRVDVSQFDRKRPTRQDTRHNTPMMGETPPGLTQVSVPFDPILRIALVNKGIIAYDDLIAAELQFRAVSGSAWVKEARDGELLETASREDSGPESRD